MGIYINPPDGSKSRWLLENATSQLLEPPDQIDPKAEEAIICLIDNTMFLAAGIAFDDHELAAFAYPDGRRKLWFSVLKEKLYPVAAGYEAYLKRGF